MPVPVYKSLQQKVNEVVLMRFVRIVVNVTEIVVISRFRIVVHDIAHATFEIAHLVLGLFSGLWSVDEQ